MAAMQTQAVYKEYACMPTLRLPALRLLLCAFCFLLLFVSSLFVRCCFSCLLGAHCVVQFSVSLLKCLFVICGSCFGSVSLSKLSSQFCVVLVFSSCFCVCYGACAFFFFSLCGLLLDIVLCVSYVVEFFAFCLLLCGCCEIVFGLLACCACFCLPANLLLLFWNGPLCFVLLVLLFLLCSCGFAFSLARFALPLFHCSCCFARFRVLFLVLSLVPSSIAIESFCLHGCY